MTDKQAIKTQVVKLTNAYYTKKGLKKTVSEGDWAKITEPCSETDADEAAVEICAYYNIDPPRDAKELVDDGLDAIADYIADRADDDVNAKFMPDQ